MTVMTKNKKQALSQLDSNIAYSFKEACKLIKEITFAKFDESVDLSVRLGVDPRKANQMVRGSVTLPHGTGKEKSVLVLCNPDKEEEAKANGADYTGLDEYLEKIKQGWTDVDVIITTPDIMPKLGRFGKVLGPRGLMPNPKTGTVTDNVGEAVKAAKSGKIDFKVDKFGIIHCSVARVSFTEEFISENALEVLQTIARLKPPASKGTYFRNVTMSSTMSPGIKIDPKSIPGI